MHMFAGRAGADSIDFGGALAVDLLSTLKSCIAVGSDRSTLFMQDHLLVRRPTRFVVHLLCDSRLVGRGSL